jgi:hypothetical protein
MEYTTNAPQGAAFLTSKMPGWQDRVALDRLDMQSATNCVLAQVHNMTYYDALDLLFPNTNTAQARYDAADSYGFDLPEWEKGTSVITRKGQWNQLRDEWVQLITELRSS